MKIKNYKRRQVFVEMPSSFEKIKKDTESFRKRDSGKKEPFPESFGRIGMQVWSGRKTSENIEFNNNRVDIKPELGGK